MLALVSALLSTAALAAAQSAPEVMLGETTLTGRAIPTLGQEFFGGIPFAEPPVGNLRLRPPVLKTSLNVSTFDASEFGVACIQSAVGLNASSEDCLTINVLRPAGTSENTSLPIMAWVYGGGFDGGAASAFNGSAIVAESVARETPIIYVNFNYRLGALGFPVGDDAGANGALNIGIRDQKAALQWIQANIATFGGDPTKVTVFGESAGAISIACLLLSPDFDQIGRAAILESGSAASATANFAGAGEPTWETFVAALPSCAGVDPTTTDTFDCVRAANTSEILAATIITSELSSSEFPWVPTLDGDIFPNLPSVVFPTGEFSKVPLITGTNQDEGTLFTPAFVTNASVPIWLNANFTPALLGQQLLDADNDKLQELYPDDPAVGSPFGTGNETFGLDPAFKRIAALNTDIAFLSQRRLYAEQASAQNVTVFTYLFTDPQPQISPALGVTHGTEIAYVYGAPQTGVASSAVLSLDMINYWVSFATSLTPNDGKGTTRTTWEQFTPDNQVVLQLNGANTTVIPDTFRKEQTDFINKQAVVYHHKRQL